MLVYIVAEHVHVIADHAYVAPRTPTWSKGGLSRGS
jgi:hypothetical protein